jgi:membrane-associated PAP2 superfamily phosphatase
MLCKDLNTFCANDVAVQDPALLSHAEASTIGAGANAIRRRHTSPSAAVHELFDSLFMASDRLAKHPADPGATVALTPGTLRPGARRWRSTGAFLLITLILGPGVLVNAVFKNHWGRPRPKHIVQFDGTQPYRPPLLKGEAGTAKSFPAGHPSVAFAYAAIFLLLRPKRPRLAWAVLGASTAIGAGMGAARMAAGGHFLSDVLWSALITWWAAWFVRVSTG